MVSTLPRPGQGHPANCRSTGGAQFPREDAFCGPFRSPGVLRVNRGRKHGSPRGVFAVGGASPCREDV